MTETFPRRLGRTLGQLVLALLNATLILVVLALFFAWRLSGTVERITDTAVGAATEQIEALTPLLEDIRGVEGQLADVREELAGLRLEDNPEIAGAAEAALKRLETLEANLDQVSAALAPAIEAVSKDPGVIVDRAVEAGIDRAGTWVADFSGCHLRG